MTTKSDVPKVYAAISAVMAHMAGEGIGKSRVNEQQRYKFRGIDDVHNALARVLSDNKLVMLPSVQSMAREERTTKSGGALNYTILTVDFKLVSAEDGSHDTIRMVGEAMDSADKSANKAQSAALKYAALQVFMIPTEGDNDADATTHEVAPRTGVSLPYKAIDGSQCGILRKLLKEADSSEEAFCEWLKVGTLPELAAAHFERAKQALDKRIAATKKTDILEDEIPY